MIHFRKVTLDDSGLLFNLMEAYYRYEQLDFDREKTSQALQLFLTHPEFGQVWLIMIDKSVVGYVVFTVSFSFEYHGFDSFLDELFILEKFRDQNIGSRVIKFLIDECKKRDIRALHLEVESWNKSARKFYRKMGFRDQNRYLMTRPVTK